MGTFKFNYNKIGYEHIFLLSMHQKFKRLVQAFYYVTVDTNHLVPSVKTCTHISAAELCISEPVMQKKFGLF